MELFHDRVEYFYLVFGLRSLIAMCGMRMRRLSLIYTTHQTTKKSLLIRMEIKNIIDLIAMTCDILADHIEGERIR